MQRPTYTFAQWELTVDFIALDVETANAGLASICQVGIVTFRDGQAADQW